MRAHHAQEEQPWVTCFLARVLIDYVEGTTQGTREIDYSALFDDLEGFETPADPQSFIKDINNWVPLAVLRKLAVWCEQTSGQKDFAYRAARSYFAPGGKHLASLFEIFLRELNDPRLSFISSQMWGSLQTNYLRLQSFENQSGDMYMLAQFPENAPAAVSSIHFLRGTIEALVGLYPFVAEVESVEEISQLRIVDIVREFPDFQVVTSGDHLLVRHSLCQDAVVVAEKVPSKLETITLSPEFIINMPDAAICPVVNGRISVLTNLEETDSKKKAAAPQTYRIVTSGELTRGTLSYVFKQGDVYDAPYCRCRFTIKQRAEEQKGKCRPTVGKEVPQLVLDHLRHMKQVQMQMIRHVIERRRLALENIRLREEIEREYSFAGIIGKSSRMRDVYRLVHSIAETDLSVLIQGETGTGKELIARAIHYNSSRRSGQFVDMNCGALVETLLESELFGHEKGAFTGATTQRKGVFEYADGGTLFLDEIGEIAPATQVNLLRILQEGRFQRVGSSESRKVDVRIIAATNQNLEDRVQNGTFRSDLYYRLNVFPITVPPLRERIEDVPLLITHFIQKHRKRINSQVTGVHPKAMAILAAYGWPGNVRELENVIQRMMVLSASEGLDIGDIPCEIRGEAREDTANEKDLKKIAHQSSAMVEKQAISDALSRHRGNVTRTAKALGISRATLQKKMKLYGLYRSDFLRSANP